MPLLRADQRCNHALPTVAALTACLVAVLAVACEGDPAAPSSPTPPPNRTPLPVGAIPPSQVGVGESIGLDAAAYFSDPDGDTLTYVAESSDTTIATAAVRDSIVTVAAVAKGAATITITATDPEGLSAQQTVAITVPNRPPEAVGEPPDLELIVGAADTVVAAAYFSDPDGDTLTYVAESSDTTIATSAVHDSIVTTAAVARGAATITITATDPEGLSAQQKLQVTVETVLPTVRFVSATSAAPEGTTAALRVMIHPPPDLPLAVAYTLGADDDGGTDDGDGADYLDPSDGTVEIGAGSESAAIEIAITDDDDIEPTREVLVVTLDVPEAEAGYVLGHPNAVVLSIEEGVCDRTPQVRDEIVRVTGADHCSAVCNRDLHLIRELNLSATGIEESWGGATTETMPCDPEVKITSDRSLHPEPVECEGQPTRIGYESAGWPTARRAVITSLREADFSELPNLMDLSLEDNGLSELPTGVFSGLHSLRDLDLDGNRLTEVPAEVFSGLANLWRLRLQNNGLKELPPGVFSGLSNLEVLYFGHRNELTRLPPRVFAGLSNLRRLAFNENRLKELPRDIFSGLGRLERLTLAGNEFTSLDADVFSSLTKLTHLRLHRNQLTVIPPSIFSGLSSLEVLNLGATGLTELPPNVFSNLSNLRWLNLQINSLTRLPPAVFSDLASLESLFLERNRLTELPKGVFVGLYGLKVLDLDENPGSPFTLTPEVRRVDDKNLLASGPAKVQVRLAQGAPFPMTIPLSAHGGVISAGVAVIDVGKEGSGDLTVTREGEAGDGTQVVVGPVPPSPVSVWGLELKTSDPVVLFGNASNLAPVAEQTLPQVRFRVRGEASARDLSGHFRDPDGDRLEYTAASGNPSVVSASVAASQLTLSPVGPGWSMVTVTATDPGGLSAYLSLSVTVRGGSSGSYDIDLVLIDDVTPSVAAAFDAAVEHWEAILADTELPDVPVGDDIELGCAGITTDRRVETVDDILIVAAIRWINGPLGPLAGAAVCGVRDGPGGLPFMGAMLFDEGDLEWLEDRGDLEDVVLHEIGHVLGIGTMWDAHGLLRNPSLPNDRGADTHFPGPMAIEAFDEAGGMSYFGGKKVPVENRAGPGSGDSHWRQSALGTELMTPMENADVPDPLSAITIQSLADMGYTVDVSLAEPFDLLGAAASVDDPHRIIDPDRVVPYGDDILPSSIIVVDRNGRIVRMIPG